MAKRINLVGQRFDKLLVLELVEVHKDGKYWLCVCDCGSEIVRVTSALKRSVRTGCKQCESATRASYKLKHGESLNGARSKLYEVWAGMRARCGQPKHKSYGNYGGLGIKVCKEWDSYLAFRKWAWKNGYHEDHTGKCDRMSIDRIDPTKNYEPKNCQWITLSENSTKANMARKVTHE